LDQLVFLVVFVITVLAANERDTPKFNASSDVWGKISNGTEWPAGIAILMSFVSVIWTMSGYDAPFHLSEECSNAAVAAPRAIVLTAEVGGLLGWVVMLVIAYTVVDIEAAVDSEIGQPYIAYLLQCLSKRTAIALAALTIIASFFMGQGCQVAASRVTYAYGRDGVFPFSQSFWGKVNKTTRTPVNAVWGNTIIGILLNLLIFGGYLSIGAIFSIGAIGQYVAFTLPTTIRTFVVGNRFRPGPWNLGRWSWLSGTISTGYTLLMLPILCFPAVRGKDLDAAGMNWTIVVWGGPMFLAMMWWVWPWNGARKWFKGPKVNVEHKMYTREEVRDMKEGNGSSEDDQPEEVRVRDGGEKE